MTRRYLSVVETAKLIRKALKAKFPKAKFSVRSESYAGGASIDVSWMDGPTTNEVDAVVKPFESRGFDGMIDMAYSKTAYLLPDGTAMFGYSGGTEGSMGVTPAYKNEMPEGAEAVSFGSNYVFTHRKVTPDLMKKALDKVVEKYGDRFGPDEVRAAIVASDYDGSAYIKDRALADKDVTGEPGWNLHWCVSSKISEALSEMSV